MFRKLWPQKCISFLLALIMIAPLMFNISATTIARASEITQTDEVIEKSTTSSDTQPVGDQPQAETPIPEQSEQAEQSAPDDQPVAEVNFATRNAAVRNVNTTTGEYERSLRVKFLDDEGNPIFGEAADDYYIVFYEGDGIETPGQVPDNATGSIFSGWETAGGEDVNLSALEYGAKVEDYNEYEPTSYTLYAKYDAPTVHTVTIKYVEEIDHDGDPSTPAQENELIEPTIHKVVTGTDIGLVEAPFVANKAPNVASFTVENVIDDATYTFTYRETDKVSYTVEYHFLQSGGNYAKDESIKASEHLQAYPNTLVTAAPPEIDGYTVKSGTVQAYAKEDGSTVLVLKYDREMVTVLFETGEGDYVLFPWNMAEA